MVINMQNKTIIWFTVLFCIISIGGNVVYQVVRDHQNHLLEVSYKLIQEAARKCVNEDKCDKNGAVTLQNLYDLGYLTEQANPLTKKVYNSSDTIKIDKGNYIFEETN
jgi:hypothetical protein